MLSFVANALVTPYVARRLARAIPNPFLRAMAIAAVGYGINRLASGRRQSGTAQRPAYQSA